MICCRAVARHCLSYVRDTCDVVRRQLLRHYDQIVRVSTESQVHRTKNTHNIILKPRNLFVACLSECWCNMTSLNCCTMHIVSTNLDGTKKVARGSTRHPFSRDRKHSCHILCFSLTMRWCGARCGTASCACSIATVRGKPWDLWPCLRTSGKIENLQKARTVSRGPG